MSLNALLVQIRRSGDPMLEHEKICMRRRLSGVSVELRERNVLETPPKADWLDGCDLMVIGGSGDFSVHDPRSRSWITGLRQLLDEALSKEVPGFGICFGHQLLGLHFGGVVRTGEEGAEAGTVEVSLTESGMEEPLFQGMGASFYAHTGHSDFVEAVPEGLELLASNNSLKTQAFRVKGAPFYSTQFHPDLTAEEAHQRYFIYQRGLRDYMPDQKDIRANFEPDKDESSELLARFVERVVQGN